MNDIQAYNVNKTIERLGNRIVEAIINNEATTYNQIINDEAVRGYLLDLILNTKKMKEDNK